MILIPAYQIFSTTNFFIFFRAFRAFRGKKRYLITAVQKMTGLVKNLPFYADDIYTTGLRYSQSQSSLILSILSILSKNIIGQE
jgi:hypothetical protein